MSNLRQAAQQALEALEQVNTSPHLQDCYHAFDGEITALRAALAEPEQNPFGDDAERYARKLHEEREYYKALFTERKPEQEPDGISWLKRDSGYFTAPTPRKPLTDEEIDRVTDQQWAQNNHKPIYAAHRAYARAIERAHGIGGGE